MQIAQAAGVSKMTVSRVLRNAEGFSEATRDKVMREVERQGYLPNRLATTFAAAHASTLMGVCVNMSVGFNEYDAGFAMSQHAILKGY